MSTTVIENFEGTPSAECPYCRTRCWVGSAEDSCGHLFATGDYMGGSVAWSRLDDELNGRAKSVVEAFRDWEIERQTAVIEKVAGRAGETLNALRNHRLWWTDFVESEVFEADIDEAMFSTIYYSVFVPDVEEVLKILKPRFLEAARAAEELGRRDYLSYLRPEHLEKIEESVEGRLSFVGGKDLDRVSVGDRLWVISRRGGLFHLLGSIVADRIVDSFDAKWVFEEGVPFEADYFVLAAEGQATELKWIEIEDKLRHVRFAGGKVKQLPEKFTARNFQFLKILTNESASLLKGLR